MGQVLLWPLLPIRYDWTWMARWINGLMDRMRLPLCCGYACRQWYSLPPPLDTLSACTIYSEIFTIPMGGHVRSLYMYVYGKVSLSMEHKYINMSVSNVDKSDLSNYYLLSLSIPSITSRYELILGHSLAQFRWLPFLIWARTKHNKHLHWHCLSSCVWPNGYSYLDRKCIGQLNMD